MVSTHSSGTITGAHGNRQGGTDRYLLRGSSSVLMSSQSVVPSTLSTYATSKPGPQQAYSADAPPSSVTMTSSPPRP
jgi:hypothetical protein